MMIHIKTIENRIIQGGEISFKEAVELYNAPEVGGLLHSANNIRKDFLGNSGELCTIMNGKSGKCSEDCKYCAQSSHYTTGIEEYDVVGLEKALFEAEENFQGGAHRFSLVTSGRGLSGDDFEKVLDIYKRIKEKSEIKLCASHGILSYEQLLRLKEAGVTRYHHNLETSREYYSSICTTHSFKDRIDTIKNAQRAGLEICSGGIIGLGESVEDRVSMAFELRDLGVISIPINILTPIKGTPLENAERIAPLEVLKTMAIYRFLNPRAYIRYAAGRVTLGEMKILGLKGGVNAALTGNFLTTTGTSIKEDVKMFKELGFQL